MRRLSPSAFSGYLTDAGLIHGISFSLANTLGRYGDRNFRNHFRRSLIPDFDHRDKGYAAFRVTRPALSIRYFSDVNKDCDALVLGLDGVSADNAYNDYQSFSFEALDPSADLSKPLEKPRPFSGTSTLSLSPQSGFDVLADDGVVMFVASVVRRRGPATSSGHRVLYPSVAEGLQRFYWALTGKGPIDDAVNICPDHSALYGGPGLYRLHLESLIDPDFKRQLDSELSGGSSDALF